MKYEPKVIYNPTDKKIEFMFEGLPNIFKPGEKRLVDGFTANHVERFLNSPLKVYEPEIDGKVSTGVVYADMPWSQLRKLASQKGVFKLGYTRDEVISALAKLDEEQGA